MKTIVLNSRIRSPYIRQPLAHRLALIAAVCSLTAATLAQADQVIHTSTGTFKLPNPAALVDATAVRSAERTASLAVSAAAADAKSAEKAVTGQQEQIDAHNIKVHDLETAAAAYQGAVAAYTSRVERFNTEAGQHTAAVAAHDARASASNALPAEQRDAGTVADLNAEKAQLDTWRSRLAEVKEALDADRDELNRQKTDLEATARELTESGDQLNADMKIKLGTLGDAYRQLLTCYRYAVDVKERLKQYNLNAPKSDEELVRDMSGRLERMKNLLGDGFDGSNPDTPPLRPEDVRPPFGAHEN